MQVCPDYYRGRRCWKTHNYIWEKLDIKIEKKKNNLNVLL